jgi:hypothetical protein
MKIAILAAAAAAVALASPALAAPTAHPDMTGVWQITGYSPTLKSADGQPPPLTPAAKAVYDKNKAALAKGDHSWDPAKACIPEGLPRLMTVNKPFEILQRDKAVFFVAQNRLPRRAYIGEQLPTDPELLYLGYSVGRWDGDSFVVDSSGFRDVTFLDDSGMPHSDQLKLTERYTPSKDGKGLDLKLTITDPKTFTKPWTSATIHYQKKPGYQIPEEVCAESLKTTAPRR